MKIIGQAGKESFIVQASQEEILQISGFEREYDLQSKAGVYIQVGATVEVGRIWQKLQQYAAMQNTSDVLRKAAQNIITTLEAVQPIVEAIDEVAKA